MCGEDLGPNHDQLDQIQWGEHGHHYQSLALAIEAPAGPMPRRMGRPQVLDTPGPVAHDNSEDLVR